MQAPLTKPNAGAIPDQQLEPILAAIVKGVGTAVAGRTAQSILDSLREPVDAGAHVDRLDDQPNLIRYGTGSMTDREVLRVMRRSGAKY